MTRPSYRFADFSLDIATRELHRGDTAVNLPPRSFDAIAYLVRNRDRAVGRDELVSAVWGKTSVSDTVLGKTILAARRALEDTVEAPRYIRTVSRFGYHWIAPVTDAIDEPVGGPPKVAAPVATTAVRRAFSVRRRLLLLAAAAFVIAAVMAARVFLAPPQDRPRATSPVVAQAPADGWTAAVIPASVAARDEDAWLRFGLMDLIALRLRVAGIPTMPSDALIRLVQPGMGTDDAARIVRNAGSVQQIFVPSVRRDGANWAVKIALLRPEGVTIDVEETAVDAIGAAHAAIDRLLQRLGHAPVPRSGGAEQLSLEELTQRLEAARLGDDFAGARRLIAQAPPAMAARPEVRLRLAQLDLRAGHLDDALHALNELLASTSAEAAPTLRAQMLYARGTALLLGTHFDQARAAYDEGVALLEHQVEPGVAAKLYMGRGNLSALQGRYEEAAADHARARIAFQLAGDGFTPYWLDGNEGALQNHLGHPAAALPLLLRAEQHFDRYHVFNELVTTQANEVVAYLALVQPIDAVAASERSLPFLDRIGDASLRRLVQLRRSMALAGVGRNSEARALLDRLLTEADPKDEGSVRGMAQATLAAIDASSAQPRPAIDAAQAALAELGGPKDIRVRASAWMTQLRALRAAGRAEEAATRTRAMRDWAAQTHHAFAAQQAALAAAEQAASTQDADARGGFDEALRQATALDLPSALVDTAVTYARFLIAHGQLEAAIAVAGRVSRHADEDYASAALQAQLYRALGQKDAEALASERMNRLAGERAAIAD
jgi:DNA-binding winged helix-turn-helix (wHTH) protein/tetratricopeptide (TPR) repeat protein